MDGEERRELIFDFVHFFFRDLLHVAFERISIRRRRGWIFFQQTFLRAFSLPFPSVSALVLSASALAPSAGNIQGLEELDDRWASGSICPYDLHLLRKIRDRRPGLPVPEIGLGVLMVRFGTALGWIWWL